MKFKRELLRELRKEKGFTHPQLAALIGVHTSAISGWETGGRSPKAENIQAIAGVFGVKPEELIDGPFLESNPYPASELKTGIPVILYSALQNYDFTAESLHSFAQQHAGARERIEDISGCIGIKSEEDNDLKSFSRGTVVLVDYSQERPRNGDLVIAKLREKKDVLVGCYEQNDNVRCLTEMDSDKIILKWNKSTHAAKIEWMFPVVKSICVREFRETNKWLVIVVAKDTDFNKIRNEIASNYKLLESGWFDSNAWCPHEKYDNPTKKFLAYVAGEIANSVGSVANPIISKVFEMLMQYKEAVYVFKIYSETMPSNDLIVKTLKSAPGIVFNDKKINICKYCHAEHKEVIKPYNPYSL